MQRIWYLGMSYLVFFVFCNSTKGGLYVRLLDKQRGGMMCLVHALPSSGYDVEANAQPTVNALRGFGWPCC